MRRLAENLAFSIQKDSERTFSTLTKLNLSTDEIVVAIENSKMLGNLLPLTCGHNGTYSIKELKAFEFHLQKAGFLL